MSKTIASLTVSVFVSLLLNGCGHQAPLTAEQIAQKQKLAKAQEDLIAAECKLYKGSGVMPDQCKKPKNK